MADLVVEGAVEPHLGPSFAPSQKSLRRPYPTPVSPHDDVKSLALLPQAAGAVGEAGPWLCKVKLFCSLCPVAVSLLL